MEHSDILGGHQFTANPPDAIQQLGRLVGVGLALNPKRKRRDFNGMTIYTTCNLWKERNRRTFDNKYSTAVQVAERTKEDIEQYRRAFATTH
jgi:hypothetical protein